VLPLSVQEAEVVVEAVNMSLSDPLVIVTVPPEAGSPVNVPVALAAVGVAVNVIDLEFAGLVMVIVWPAAVLTVPETVPVWVADVPPMIMLQSRRRAGFAGRGTGVGMGVELLIDALKRAARVAKPGALAISRSAASRFNCCMM
jgi:hypothetical protein